MRVLGVVDSHRIESVGVGSSSFLADEVLSAHVQQRLEGN